MTRTPWHLDDDLLAAYAALAVSPSQRASVEAHLLSCASCRALVAERGAASALRQRLDDAWSLTVERVDQPRRTWMHRLAVALGVPDHLARVIGTSAAFRSAWMVSMALAVGAGVAIARGELGPVPFLLLAPLVPVVGVAAAYGGSTRANDSRAFELATPFGELRLVLLRAAAVTASSIVLLGLVSLIVPTAGLEAVAWLLPALALTTTTLALTTRFTPERAAEMVALGWVCVIAAAAFELPSRRRPTAPDLAGIAAPLQVTALVLLVVSTALFIARRHRLELPVH